MLTKGFICSFFAVSAACACAQSGPVTYSTKAALAPKVLAEISKVSGVRLETGGKLANDILIVSVKDVSLSELMKKIAGVIDAEWETTKSGFRLVRTDGLEAKLRAGVRELRAKDFDANIKQRMTGAQAQPPFVKDRARALASQLEEALKGSKPNAFTVDLLNAIGRLTPKLPTGRGIDRMIAALGGKELATLPEGRRVVYGLPATRMQRTLPPAAIREVDAIVRESEIWSEALRASAIDQEFLSTSLPMLHATLTARPAKLNLIVTRNATTVQAQLKLYNDAGVNTHQAFTYLAASSRPRASIEPKSGEPEIAYSDASKQIVELASQVFSRTEPAPLPDSGLRRALLDPESIDPLSFVISEALFQTAHDREANLVATVSDAMFAGPYNVLPKTSSVLVSGLNDMGLTVAESDGWLTVKPRDPFRMWEARTNRNALGELMRSAARDSRVSLDALLRFAPTCRSAEWPALPAACATLMIGSPIFLRDLQMTKVVGLMSPSQRKQAEIGVEVRRLDPVARGIVVELVYGTDQGVGVDTLERPTVAEQRIATLFANGIFREPTESMPDGLPTDAMLRIADSTRHVVYEVGKRVYERPMSLDEVGMNMYFLERPEEYPNTPPRNFDRLNLGQRREMSAEIRLTSQLWLSRRLEDLSRDYSKVYSLKGLPADWQRVIEARLAELRGSAARSRPPP
jgi:hypothetical protein